MKHITKDLSLALAYKKWLENLNKKKLDHPEYKSSFKFYKDVVGNLLWVQKGLCAYTEMFLLDPERVSPKNWNKGRITDFDFMGHLDHYDSSLKPEKGWEWDNFFVVHSDVNVKVKGQKKVNSILKPDKAGYNPFYYLRYDFKTHNFYPNSERELSLQNKILEDINTLGLNYQPIIDYRKEYLNPIIDDVLIGQKTVQQGKDMLQKFNTAFLMSIQSLGLE